MMVDPVANGGVTIILFLTKKKNVAEKDRTRDLNVIKLTILTSLCGFASMLKKRDGFYY